MKQKLMFFCVAALILAACNNEKKEETKSAETVTPGDTKEKEWIPVDSATAMKAWMDYATPGEPHKKLAAANGTWDAEVTSWMAMGAPPTVSKGSAVNRMVMDGRYQVSEFSGDMMGMPFNGQSTTAYDNYKKVFVSTWIDNMGTGIMMMEGPWDEATKTMTLTGKYPNPANGIDCEMKETFTMTYDNNHLMEMYGPDPQTGKQYKTMQIKFTRKK
jgi:hypothetical protein